MPTPAITSWSVNTFLTLPGWPVIAVRKAARSNDGSSGSGPRRAMPSTSFGSRTMYAASRFSVPISVTSKPAPPFSRTRNASGPLLGLARPGGSASFHRIQPPRARCSTRCNGPSTPSGANEKSRNFPCRPTPAITRPRNASGDGSNVFSTANETTSTRSMAEPLAFSLRNWQSASTSGSSGTRVPLRPHRPDDPNPPVPRALAGNDSTAANDTCSTGWITNCAMRSPRRTSYGSSGSVFNSTTRNSSR